MHTVQLPVGKSPNLEEPLEQGEADYQASDKSKRKYSTSTS